MKEIGQLNYEGFIKELEAHIQARESGSLFLVTREGHPVKIVLLDGEVTALAYQGVRGEAALAPIRESTQFTGQFYRNCKLLAAKESIPNTGQILAILKDDETDQQSELMDTQVNISAPSRQDEPALPVTLGKLESILLLEATELLGPFASVLCERHLQEASDPPTRSQLNAILEKLEEDIRDAKVSRMLKDNVNRQLA